MRLSGQPDALQKQFEQSVGTSFDEELSHHVKAAGERLDSQCTSRANAIVRTIRERTELSQQSKERFGHRAPPVAFQSNRRALLAELETRSATAMRRHQEERKALEIGVGFRRGIVQAFVLEAAAVGSTTLIAALSIDWTGLLGAGAFAVLGAAVLPVRRAAAKRQFEEKLMQLQRELRRTATSQLQDELVASCDAMRVRGCHPPTLPPHQLSCPHPSHNCTQRWWVLHDMGIAC